MEQISDQRCAPLDLNAIRSSMKAMDETSKSILYVSYETCLTDRRYRFL